MNLKQFVNLRAIDEYLSENKENKDLFCQLFEKKLKIFEEMKNGRINAQIYLKMQKQIMESTQKYFFYYYLVRDLKIQYKWM